MRKYLRTLHQRSPAHKKRFAMLASATVTLFIFSVWSFAKFGAPSGTVATNEGLEAGVSETSPIDPIRSNVASTIESMRKNFESLFEGFNNLDFNAEYVDMRDKALDTYGK